MCLYVLANIGELSDDVLAEWIRKAKPQHYHCPDMDVWLVDAYFRQEAQPSNAAERHVALSEGFNIAGRKTLQSKWDQVWDIHDYLLGVKNVYVGDIETIQTLSIPSALPEGLEHDTKDQLLRNFLQHAKQSLP